VIEGIPDLVPDGRPADGTLVHPALDLTVLLLAWNEADNLTTLLPRITAVVNRLGLKHEVVVVDAGSSDGTPEVAARHGARVMRQTRPGYSAALLDGLALARGRFIATMDADLSHDPELLETMWERRSRAALVIASRYADGGQADMPLYRLWASKLLNRVYAASLSVPVRDMSCAYRLYRADALKAIQPRGRHFDILEDIIVRMTSAGHAVLEVPLHHRERQAGRSHVRFTQFALSYAGAFGRLWRIRHSRAAADRDDRAYRSMIPAQGWFERRRAAALARLAEGGDRVLVVGCGSSPLLSLLPVATGTDASAEKLRWARRFERPLVRALPTVLPFAGASFDVVVLRDGVAADRGRQLDEAVRVLTPDGTVVGLVPLQDKRGLQKTFGDRGLVLLRTQAVSPLEWAVAARKTAPAAAQAPRIGLGIADISPLQRHYVNDVLRKNRLSYGEYSRRFEREFAALHDRRYAIFCNSGTSALQVAVHALRDLHGWADGDEVLVPAVTFVASSNVVLQNRLRPVFVDVEPDHYGIDPAQLERHITPRTRAIMPVHLFGQPCAMDPILDVARRRGLRMLEDSCETMFVRYRGRPTGSWGDAACFSSYVAHLIVTGVGGLVLTDEEPLATLMKSLMNHGRDNIYLSIDDDDGADADRLRQIVARRFSFIHVGYSYRATEMEAALGVGELARHRETLRRRQENARYLTAQLQDLRAYLQLPGERPQSEHAYMMYPVVAADGVDRDALLLYLEQSGIETRHLMPLINQPVYRRLFGDLEPQYPVAARLNRSGFAIGCHQGLRRQDLDYVSETLHRYFS